jgi:hypothetical protein
MNNILFTAIIVFVILLVGLPILNIYRYSKIENFRNISGSRGSSGSSRGSRGSSRGYGRGSRDRYVRAGHSSHAYPNRNVYISPSVDSGSWSWWGSWPLWYWSPFYDPWYYYGYGYDNCELYGNCL